jgi:hypothetical protein
MNDRRAWEAPLSVGIAWSASKSGKLVDLTASEGTSAADTVGAGADGNSAINEEDAAEEEPGME